jgi:signal transduction histidine kinase
VTYGRFFEMIHPEDRERAQSALRAAIAGTADYAAEYRVIDPAGQLRWISSMGRCFHNGSHRMFGVTQSITERKQAAEILEKTVAERTAELQQTIGELEAFSYSISHDLRAPLRSMQGFADVLMEDFGATLGPEGQGYVQRIRASAERMDRLIQDVLTFSRVARSEVNLEPVNLDHLLRGIVECYPNLQPPQADILIEGRLPYVLGKAAALTQCLSNLLGNAVKFVARGTRPQVRIWAEIIPARAQPAEQMSHANSTRGASGASLSTKPAGGTAYSAEGGFVRLFIEDNGIGIQKEGQEKIFAIFQRLSKGYEGTGIGLAIVKKAAERMGGRVGVHSEAGKGSTFWLELQAAEPPRA